MGIGLHPASERRARAGRRQAGLLPHGGGGRPGAHRGHLPHPRGTRSTTERYEIRVATTVQAAAKMVYSQFKAFGAEGELLTRARAALPAPAGVRGARQGVAGGAAGLNEMGVLSDNFELRAGHRCAGWSRRPAAATPSCADASSEPGRPTLRRRSRIWRSSLRIRTSRPTWPGCCARWSFSPGQRVAARKLRGVPQGQGRGSRAAGSGGGARGCAAGRGTGGGQRSEVAGQPGGQLRLGQSAAHRRGGLAADRRPSPPWSGAAGWRRCRWRCGRWPNCGCATPT